MVNFYCDQARFWFVGHFQGQRLVDLGAFLGCRTLQGLHDAAELVEDRRDVGHSELSGRCQALELCTCFVPFTGALRELLGEEGGALRGVFDRAEEVLDLAVQLLDPLMQRCGGRVLAARRLLTGRQPLSVGEGRDPLIQALEDRVLAHDEPTIRPPGWDPLASASSSRRRAEGA
ncbi:hypothetical protein E1262_06575 [Jiangella aurantiaca]|uniref:Uncharacterized protein n=1 Tax=Jiangella aurantiaca TaxID=2530373 RepID=A0A4R5AM57_9ACTN|nr:hypothetical protein [Jiangella aurantiaca]TDD71272.1 hypothetical protein E1262_06575 [Jiangella aurantiaca]